MNVTLVYDNTAWEQDLTRDWGFSCLIEMENTSRILFDTGASSSILLNNMEKLGIDPATIDIVVISHGHRDHIGGLPELVKANKVSRLYLPASFRESFAGRKVVEVKGSLQVCKNLYSTGELMGMEQSLVVRTDKGLVVIAGCSHPGVGPILDAASRFGRVYALIGGLHGFCEFDLLEHLQWVCPCHCTQHKSEIKRLYPGKCVDGGAGKVISV